MVSDIALQEEPLSYCVRGRDDQLICLEGGGGGGRTYVSY